MRDFEHFGHFKCFDPPNSTYLPNRACCAETDNCSVISTLENHPKQLDIMDQVHTYAKPISPRNDPPYTYVDVTKVPDLLNRECCAETDSWGVMRVLENP